MTTHPDEIFSEETLEDATVSSQGEIALPTESFTNHVTGSRVDHLPVAPSRHRLARSVDAQKLDLPKGIFIDPGLLTEFEQPQGLTAKEVMGAGVVPGIGSVLLSMRETRDAGGDTESVARAAELTAYHLTSSLQYEL